LRDQLLLVSDTVGRFQAFTPKFVKKYYDVAQVVPDAMKQCVHEVKIGAFPDEDQYCYHMVEGEEDKSIRLMTE
jgi:3-methyl-2-oxobutanoate hydroxymethyltransferase